jgi:hypothetical protein
VNAQQVNDSDVLEAIWYVRRLTLTRGLRGYVDWVARAVGWGTVAWMLFWLVIYAIASAQLLPKLTPPIASRNLPSIFSGLAAVGLLFVAIRSRTPPAFLGRRDLYRLGLPALPGEDVMTWPLAQARGARFALGAVLGGAWTLVGSAWFGLGVPFAALALGLVWMASLDLEWLAYAARDRDNRAANLGLGLMLTIVIGSSLTVWLFGMGLLSALWQGHLTHLIVPVALAGVGWVFTSRSLNAGYPSRFASHAQILSELRAMQFMMLLTRQMPDPDQQRRLRDQLRDAPTAIRPHRFLPAPDASRGPLAGLAWRTALTLYRRPLLEQLDLLVRMVAVAVSSLSIVRGPGGLALEVIALAFLLPRLIGPESPAPTWPINGGERTLGRTLPGIALILVGAFVAGMVAVLIGGFDVNTLTSALARTVLALLILEKFAIWRGTSAASVESAVSAGLLAVAPTVLLDLFGLSAFAPFVQVALIGLLVLPTP